MRDYTHIINGILMGFVIFVFLNILKINILSTYPSILFYFGSIIIASVCLDYFESTFFKEHNRQLHSLFILILPVTLIMFSFPFHYSIGLGLLVGFIGHIFLDLFTPYGCPLFYPVSSYNFRVFKKDGSCIKTGSTKEKTFTICLVIILILSVWGTTLLYPNNFLNGESGNNPENTTNISTNLMDTNVNIYIQGGEEKNITLTDSNNNTNRILVQNYDSLS